MKGRVDKKSLENERIWKSERGSILDDFIKIKQLVDEHHKIRSGKWKT
jgi:hypothetical protein